MEDRGRNKLDVPWNRKAGGGRVWQVMGRVIGVSITSEFVWIELLFFFCLFYPVPVPLGFMYLNVAMCMFSLYHYHSQIASLP